MSERNYEFRRRLNQVHQPDRRDASLRPGRSEAAVAGDWRIVVGVAASPYLLRVAQDLQDYFLVSMGLSLLLERRDAEGALGEIGRAHV